MGFAEEIQLSRISGPDVQNIDRNVRATLNNHVLQITSIGEFLLKITINGRVQTLHYETIASVDVSALPAGSVFTITTDQAVYSGVITE